MKFFHLYDYQQDMKGRIKEAFRSHQSVMIQMPIGTGTYSGLYRRNMHTGKTYLLAAVVSEYIARNQGRVWILAHLLWPVLTRP